MLTIAIDSSQEICTIALGRNSAIVAEYHFAHKMNLLRRLLPNIESMLTDNGLATNDLDGVILSLGPGSFTGLRIGGTIAKSLAYVMSKPIVGVGTLDAIAYGVAPVKDTLICPMIFARADEAYWSLFDCKAGTRLSDYTVSPIDEVLDDLAARDKGILFVGTGARRNWEKIRSRLGDAVKLAPAWCDFARGAALIELGTKRLMAGEDDNAMVISPVYVRKPTPVIRLETGQLG